MRTFVEIDQEIATWRQAILDHNQEVAKQQTAAEKIAPNRGILFRDIETHEKMVQGMRRLNGKIASAQNEIARCQSEWAAVAAHVAKLRANLDGYKEQLKPGGIDWSKVDLSVDRDAYFAELRLKVGNLEVELKTYV